MGEQPKDDKQWEQYRKPKGTKIKKTKSLIKRLLKSKKPKDHWKQYQNPNSTS